MHISLVPRLKVGKYIFTQPLFCVPVCEFFPVPAWHAYVHTCLLCHIKKWGWPLSPAFLPCVVLMVGPASLQTHPVASVLWLTRFSPPHSSSRPCLPSTSVTPSVQQRHPLPSRVLPLLLQCSTPDHAWPPWPFHWQTATLTAGCRKGIFYFFGSKNQFESEPFFFLFCSFFFM